MPDKFAGKFITHLKKLDKERIERFLRNVLQEKDFLQLIFQSLLEGIIVTDLDSRILFINQAARRLLGLSPKRAVLGMELRQFVGDEQLSDCFASLPVSLSQVITRELEVTFPQPALYTVSALAVSTDTEEPEALVFIIDDISRRREEQRESWEEEKLASLATLTAGVAHEIKNPLNSLNIHGQLLKRALDQPGYLSNAEKIQRFRSSIEVILEEIKRLTSVINQFIKAVHPAQLNLERENINRLIEQLAKLLAPELEEKHIQLRLDLDREIPPTLVDAQQVHQALLNVLKNAIEAIHANEGVITIATQIKDEWLEIAITDNGCGIEPENLRRIFEPYFTTKHSGLGLGLMIVYRIIKKHGGKIDVQSTPGKHTTFRIRLPLVEKPIKLLAEKLG